MSGAFRGGSMGPQLLIGAGIVVFGLALTSANLGHGGDWIVRFWPLVFAFVGGSILLEPGSSSSRRLFGTALVVAGVWWTANTAFGLGIYIDDWWPLILVGFGGFMIYRAMNGRDGDRTAASSGRGPAYAADGASSGAHAAGWSGDTPSNAVPPDPSREELVNAFAVMSGVRRTITSPLFRRASVTAVMGGVVLDLRQCMATGGETIVDVFAMWGGLEVIVPPDWQVINEVSPIMGGVDDRSGQQRPVRHRLVLKGVVIMAGVEVKS